MGKFARRSNSKKKEDINYKIRQEERLSVKASRKAEKRDKKREAKKGKNKTMEEKFLVVVYDHLRKGGKHHINLNKETVFVGTFDSEPSYFLFSLQDGAFAGIKEHGNTSITMEVYEVTEEKLDDIDDIVRYDASAKDEDNLYLRKIINTPYGEAYVYIYNEITLSNIPIENGDWIDYLETKKFTDGNKDLQRKLDLAEKEIEDEKHIQLALSEDIDDDEIPTVSFEDVMNGNILNINKGFNKTGDAWNADDSYGYHVD